MSLEIENAKQHADTLAARHDYFAAQLYLDLVDALISGPDAAVEAAREACIRWEITEYRMRDQPSPAGDIMRRVR